MNHLAADVSESELKSQFAQFGVIRDGKVHIRRGNDENYAYVNYCSQKDAQRAAAAMNEKEFRGRRVSVKVQGAGGESTKETYAVKVSNLAKHVSEEVLEGLFGLSETLNVLRVNVIECEGQPFNYAYVNYGKLEDAQKAATQLNGRRVGGSNIKVRVHTSGSMSSPQSRMPPATFLPQSPPQFFQSTPSYRPQTMATGLQLRAPMHPRPVITPPQFIRPPAFAQRPRSSLPQRSMVLQPQTGVQAMASFGAGTKPLTNSVKVSILGDLSSEDLEGAFSKFGEIREQPIIRLGTPKYAYINFQSCSEAVAACQLHGHQIRGVGIQVKLSGKQTGPKAVSNQDCKAVAFDPLVVRLLMSNSQDKVQKITETQQVRIIPMKSNNGLNLWGESTKLDAAEMCVRFLLEKIQEDIDEKSFTLHCLYVPRFRDCEVITQISQIEGKHGVEFTVVDHAPLAGVTTIATFGTIISGHFTHSTASPSASADTPQVSCIPTFLETAMPTPTEFLWLWEDDQGYTPYQPDLCGTLSKQFSATPKGSFQCQITTDGGTTNLYIIDFASMTQTNTSTGTQRSIQYQAGSPRWFYTDDHKHLVPYTPQDSAEIERMYTTGKSANLAINGRMYTFDFTRMKQINLESRYKRPIERRLETDGASTSSYKLGLKVRGMEPNLQTAIDELKEELSGGVVTSEQMLPSSSDATLHASLLETTGKHFVDATISENKIILRGIQGYIEKVMFLVRQQILAYEQRIVSQRSASSKGIETPDCWEPQVEKIELKTVAKGSSEWNKIQRHVHKTLPSAQISKLERIQNQWLWEKHTFSKQRMTVKNRGDVNEKELFHGTRGTPPEKIFKSEHGFDFRFASKGLWGEGTYLAASAQYSDNYAYSVGDTKQMILAKVLTGETYRCQPDGSLKKPPVKSQLRGIHSSSSGVSGEVFEDERYDSVSGHTNGSDIYVIYDHDKAYPAYLITYRTATMGRMY